jgi:tRNA A37 methylthiotransferase MiaB
MPPALKCAEAYDGKLSGMRVYLDAVNICGRRQLDLQKIRTYLIRNNHTLSDAAENSDAALLMACAFNNKTEQNAVEAFKRIQNCRAPIYLLEGIAETAGPRLGAEACIGLRDFSLLDRYFKTRVSYDAVEEQNCMYSNPDEHKYYIQVSHGCADHCAYCGDKKIVGELVSKPLQQCIAEAMRGIAKGFYEIELIGDDVGAWGLDLGSNVCVLLNAICGIAAIRSLTMQEVNIKYLIKNLKAFEQILALGKIRSMVVAIQSGNSRILEAMKRGYSREDVDTLLSVLWRYDIQARFHVIIGFPGETEDEFADTMDMICTNPFAGGTVFTYQSRDYTSAGTLPVQLSELQIRERRDRAIKILTERKGRPPEIQPDKLWV